MPQLGLAGKSRAAAGALVAGLTMAVTALFSMLIYPTGTTNPGVVRLLSPALRLRCLMAPPCPLTLSEPPIGTVVPAGSLFGVVFAGCAVHAASLVPEEHLRCSRSLLDGLVVVRQCMALPHSAPRRGA